MIKAFIFDVDGVLVHSEGYSFEATKLMLAKFGFELTKKENKKFIGRSLKDIIAIINKGHNLDIPTKKAVALREITYHQVAKNIKVFPGVRQLLNKLKLHKIRVIAASSGTEKKIRFNLMKSGLTKYFKHKISGEHCRHSKPNPQIFLKADALMHVKPSECIVVEDSVNGVKAAKRAKMKCIAVTNTYSRSKLKKAGADLVVKSLKEVTIKKIMKLGE